MYFLLVVLRRPSLGRISVQNTAPPIAFPDEPRWWPVSFPRIEPHQWIRFLPCGRSSCAQNYASEELTNKNLH
jgi:hypothetical protein